jgi:hypothetical protein
MKGIIGMIAALVGIAAVAAGCDRKSAGAPAGAEIDG